LIAGAGAWIVGLRGFWLLLTVAVVFMPIAMLVAGVIHRVMSPRLFLSDQDARSVLQGRDDARDDE
jgi:hypothetical protein